MNIENILSLYGLRSDKITVKLFGDGLINHTWKVNTGNKNYILQRVNDQVFKNPSAIDENMTMLREYLKYKDPTYLFVSPIKSLTGLSLIDTETGFYRLFPFIEGSASLNSLTNEEEAFQAAKQFGKFSKILADFDESKLNITIPDFHNLSLRYEQFIQACKNADHKRLKNASESIDFINSKKDIVSIYNKIVEEKEMPLRVIHHDTKISNVLFDDKKMGLCVIDLDTVMPGYFISDVGDMMRTYLTEVTEEETDFSKLIIRKDFFKAIYNGYMSEMQAVLTAVEKQYFIYGGKFIIYMQIIRFLADYLQNDIYYGARYETHNLNRAKNQIALFKEYIALEEAL